MFNKAFTFTVLVATTFVLAPSTASASVPAPAENTVHIVSVQGSGGVL